jgi:hypothetical protein
VRRRGLANGVMFAGWCVPVVQAVAEVHWTLLLGTAMGGLVLPLTLPMSIRRYGIQTTLRASAVGFLLFVLPVLPFIRGREPDSRNRGPRQRGSVRPLKSYSFWLLLGTVTIQSLAYFCTHYMATEYVVLHIVLTETNARSIWVIA